MSSGTPPKPQNATKRTIKAVCEGPEPARKRLLLTIKAASLEEFHGGLQKELTKHLGLPADSAFEIECFEKEFEAWVIPTDFDHIEEKTLIRVQMKLGKTFGDASSSIASTAVPTDTIASASGTLADAACPAGEKCIVCLDNQPSGIHCESTDKHFTCGSCLCHYTRASCEGPHGDFERAVLGGPALAVESPPGELPCPMFKQGCACESLPRTKLFTVMGSKELANGQEVLDTLLAALQRVAVNKQLQERAAQEAAEQAEAERLGKVAKARRAVQVALQRGQSVPCPICNEAWRKDDACMHMDCSKCGHKFCYVCGRSSTKGDCARGSGCDAQSPFLERNPDWSEFSGHEALIEFQIRLMAFYVHVARYLMGKVWWERLLETEPTLLNNVIEGRSITIEAVDAAVEPPLFGRNKVDPTARRLEIARRKAEALRFLQPEVTDLRQEEEGPEADSQVSIFTELTGAEEEIAVYFLSSHGQDLPKAIEAFEAAKKSEEDVSRGGASSSAHRDEAITGLAPPVSILVEGAGAYGRSVNGEYRQQGSHNDKPLYRQVGGQSVMYWSGGMWKINDEDSLSGWYYSVQSTADLPPERQWTTEGYRGREVNPPPTVRHRRGQAQRELVPTNGTVVVEGAGGVGAQVNGTYRASGVYQSRPKFRQVGGQSIIYWNQMWRINYRDDTGGWYYSHLGEPENPHLPPEGPWTTEGYSCRNADPPPAVRRVGFEQQQEPPRAIRVSGAGGVGEACNGEYLPAGQHSERTKYQLNGGTAIIYFNQGAWRINDEDITTGWYYQANSDALYPPEGTWTTEGYDNADADPAPLVEHIRDQRRAPPIASWRDCRVGEQVRVFPADLAEGPTRASAANWTRSCADHAGQVGSIVQVDHDNTIQLRFEDGELLWYAVGSCTKTLQALELEHRAVEVWVTGAGQRGVSLNGVYREAGQHRGRPLYRKVGSGAVIYFNNFWKMSPSSLTGWFYSVLGNFPLPPEGPWTTHGYGSRDVLPAPRVLLCEPLLITVEEAGGSGEVTNGRYRQVDVFNDRPKYCQDGGTSIIYWAGGFWKLNFRDCTAGWYYCIRSEEPYPPVGRWTLEGYSSGDANPAPVIQQEILQPEEPPQEIGEPIARAADCRVGERVRVLPLHLAEQPTRDSSATWTEACAAKCGQEGTIIHVDRDETIRIRFEDGRNLWLSVRSCTKVGVQVPEGWKVTVRGAGGRGSRLNGTYRQDGEHNGKPLYRQVDGNGVVYYGQDDSWRISPGSLGGWFYSFRTESLLPPEGQWTTNGFNGKDVLPAPTVQLEPDDEEAPKPPRRARAGMRGRGQARDDSSDSESSRGQSSGSSSEGEIPQTIAVTGAGGVGAKVNGTYRRCGTFKHRPKYRQVGGDAIIYFRERWKINFQDDISGWYYSIGSYEQSPPACTWTTEGYDDDDANPPPSVEHRDEAQGVPAGPAPVGRTPIARWEDCSEGEKVRILPVEQAKPPALESPASWTDECAAHCGDIGEIVAVDNDGTIRVQFEDGDLFWFAVASCTKELE